MSVSNGEGALDQEVATDPLEATLTRYDLQVLERILLGESNKEIATQLGCTVKNVEYHVRNILRRTRLPTRLKLIARMLKTR